MNRIVVILTSAAAALLAGMMAVTFADVIGRYFLNAPISGSDEIIGLMMGGVMFAALPRITRDEEHITVDLLEKLYRGRAKAVRRALILVGGFVMYATIAALLFQHGEERRAVGGETLNFRLPEAPFYYVFAALCALTCLAMLSVVPKIARQLHRQLPDDDDGDARSPRPNEIT